MTKTWLITGASSGLGRLMTERRLVLLDHKMLTVLKIVPQVVML